MSKKNKKHLKKPFSPAPNVGSIGGLIRGAAAMQSLRTDAWVNQISGLNIPGRDKLAYTEFVRSIRCDARLLDDMFQSDAVTQRIIKIFPEEAIRKGWEISGDDKGVVANIMRKLNFADHLTIAAMWARLYGGAILFLGLNDGQRSDMPLNVNTLKSIDYIHVYDRYQAVSWTGTYDFDIFSQNYGNPVIYNITDPMTGSIYEAHYSRIIRIDGITMSPRRRLANNSWGESIMTSCYEYIRNYCSCLANVATMFNDLVKNVLSIENLKQMLASDSNGVNTRISTLALASSNTNFLVLDASETLDRQVAQLAGYPELFNTIALGLCAATDIPSVRLFGIEPKGLNASAESTIKNMYDAISSYQQSRLAAPIKKMAELIMLCSDYGFGKVPEIWDVKFAPLMQLSDVEAATVRKTMAEADRIYVEAGILTRAEVSISRFGGEDYSLETEIDVGRRSDPSFTEQVAVFQAESDPESERGSDTDDK